MRQSRARPRPARRRRSRGAPRGGFPSSAGRSTGRCRGRAARWALWKHVQPEVEEARRNRRAVDHQMPLDQMPAAWPNDERRGLVAQAVALRRPGCEGNRPAHGVAEILLALDDVLPGRRARVFEVRHEDTRARVQRVDHHLAVDRTGDLDAAVEQVGRRRCDLPSRPHGSSVSRRESRSARRAASSAQQLVAPRPELALQEGDEGERVGRKDVRIARGQDGDVVHGGLAQRPSTGSPTILAGTPRTLTFAGTSLVTTAPAPQRLSAPIEVRSTTTAPRAT